MRILKPLVFCSKLLKHAMSLECLRLSDPEIVIRDAASLPYGGIHHGLEGAKQHVEGAVQTWNHLQPEAARKMNGVFLDAGESVVVLWRLKGLEASSGRTLDSPRQHL